MVIYDRWINSVFSAGSSISTSGSNIIMSAPEEGNWIQLTTEVEAGIDNKFSFDVPVLEGAAESGMQVMIIETRDNTPYVIGGGYLMPGGRKQTISFNASGNTVNLLFNGPFSTAEIEQICTHYTKTTQQSYLVEVCDESKDKYRFGFNGMEKDNELKGIGNSLDFGARIYDSRVARWLSLDPLAAEYPSLSPYDFVANNPIKFIDPDGKKIRTRGISNTPYIKIVDNVFALKSIQEVAKPFIGRKFDINFTHQNFATEYGPEYNNSKGYTTLSGMLSATTTNFNSNTTIATKPNDAGQSFEYRYNDIGRLSTTIHEFYHSVIMRNVKEKVKGTGDEYMNKMSDNQEHNLLAKKYRGKIVENLTEYNEVHKLGLKEGEIQTLSWMGLETTEEFKTTFDSKEKVDAHNAEVTRLTIDVVETTNTSKSEENK